MSKASDINNLYARFGGRPDTYQEITQQKSLSEARKRWPLLRAIDGEEVPAQETVVPVSFPQDSQHKTSQEFTARPVGRAHQADEDVEQEAPRLDLGALRRPGSRHRVTPEQEAPSLARDDSDERTAAPRQTPQPRSESPSKARVAAPVSQRPPLREAEAATGKDQAISDVFSKLAGRKKPLPEPAKPQGIFGALRKVVRK